MRAALPLLLFVLAGCNSAARKAENDYKSLSAVNASPDKLCKAASEAADAWGRGGDQVKYKEWSEKQQWACIDAEICRTTPVICMNRP